ncbi:MAG: hypothetical protein M3Y48_10200 [Actinomycetota bacterium]|nr:hypothetical protein [Actinomycetota bacterium]
MTVDPELRGQRVVLVPVTAEHVPDLRRILLTPEVQQRWGDEAASAHRPFDDPSATRFAIVVNEAVRGMVQASSACVSVIARSSRRRTYARAGPATRHRSTRSCSMSRGTRIPIA